MKQLHRYYLFSTLHDMAFFAAVLVPFFKDWGGLSIFQMQLIQSWFMMWVFLLEIPTGAVADYFGRKVSLIIGSAVLILATIVYTIEPNLSYFLLAEVIFALGFSLISGAGEAWVYDTLKEEGNEEKAKSVFGRARSFQFFGIMIGSIVGGFLAARFGLISPMQFTASKKPNPQFNIYTFCCIFCNLVLSNITWRCWSRGWQLWDDSCRASFHRDYCS